MKSATKLHLAKFRKLAKCKGNKTRCISHYKRNRLNIPLHGTDDYESLIGERFIGAKPLPILYKPATGAKVLYTAPAGAAIGVVYDVVKGTNNKNKYYQFYTASNKPYYVLAQNNLLDKKALDQEKEDSKTILQKAQPLILYGIGAYALIEFGKAYISKKK